jgi:hypothetical protein
VLAVFAQLVPAYFVHFRKYRHFNLFDWQRTLGEPLMSKRLLGRNAVVRVQAEQGLQKIYALVGQKKTVGGIAGTSRELVPEFVSLIFLV